MRARLKLLVAPLLVVFAPDDSHAATVSLKGAGGYSADAVFSRCRVGKGRTTVTMVCR